jgi:hypothetical protein
MAIVRPNRTDTVPSDAHAGLSPVAPDPFGGRAAESPPEEREPAMHADRTTAPRCRRLLRRALRPGRCSPRRRRRHAYLSHHWPHHLPVDALETTGRLDVLGHLAGLAGLVALVDDVIEGSTAPIASAANVVTFGTLFLLHAVNICRCRRRRSVLMITVLGPALLLAPHGHPLTTDDLWVLVGAVWLVAVASDRFHPQGTYLVRKR